MQNTASASFSQVIHGVDTSLFISTWLAPVANLVEAIKNWYNPAASKIEHTSCDLPALVVLTKLPQDSARETLHTPAPPTECPFIDEQQYEREYEQANFVLDLKNQELQAEKAELAHLKENIWDKRAEYDAVLEKYAQHIKEYNQLKAGKDQLTFIKLFGSAVREAILPLLSLQNDATVNVTVQMLKGTGSQDFFALVTVNSDRGLTKGVLYGEEQDYEGRIRVVHFMTNEEIHQNFAKAEKIFPYAVLSLI